MPFFTVLLAGALLVDEKITGQKLVGILIGIAGAIILIGPEALGGITSSALGQIAVIVAAVSYALAGVFARRFKDWGISPLMVATGQVTTAAIMLVPLALMVDQPWTLPVPALPVIGAVIGLALLSTVVAYILYFRLIASAGATNAALVTFLIPVSAILLGVLILGETFTPLQAFGMGLIGAGLLALDGRFLKRR
jgi:drug/metabolite transporter (DMT)-like permease